jgi:signal transduction histidine kinase
MAMRVRIGRLVATSGIRERLQFALAIGIVGAAAIVYIAPRVPDDDDLSALLESRLDAALAAAIIGIAFLLRSRPGLMTIALASASALLERGLESAWLASASVAQFAEWARPGAGIEPEYVLSSLPVLARSTVPAAILALYATAPERRLGRWFRPIAWLLVAGTALVAVARPFFEASIWPPDMNDPWWYTVDNLVIRDFDNLLPLLVITVVAIVGALRDEAHRYVAPAAAAVAAGARRAFVPSRALLTGIGAVLVVWVFAALLFANRPVSPNMEVHVEDDARATWLPVLLILIGFVVSRWSVVPAWLALAGALQVASALVFFRAVTEYVLLVPPGLANEHVSPSPLVVALLLAGVFVQIGAFATAAPAVRFAIEEGLADGRWLRTWAIRGAAVGFAIDTWYVAKGLILGGFPWSIEIILLPAYPLFVIVLGLWAWRRLVPAVAEAEAVATRPFQVLRYLETVISEAISGGAEQRRRAVEAERARLASTLHAEFLPNLERLATRTAAGAPPEEVRERLRELQDDVRRLMAERRLVILEEFGIVEALEWLIAQAEERVSFAVELTVDDASTADRPPREVERAAFRIAQLAVENAIQHAGPSRLVLSVVSRSDRLAITVADDGHWVAPSTSDRRRDHVGLADMRSEADHVRAAVEVLVPHGGGTTVHFAWPAASPLPAGTPTSAPAPGPSG